MKSVDELWTEIEARVEPLPAKRVPLAEALGRVLGEVIVADADQPPFTRSAIDGYLVAAGELGRELRVAGENRPGTPAAFAPQRGSAMRIFTGSALPDEGVELIMQEEVESCGTGIRLLAAPTAEHIRARGAHARAGAVLMPRGTPLTAGGMALLATVGAVEPLVSPPIRIAHFVTGSELVPPDQSPREGEIRDTNTSLIGGLATAAGATVAVHHRLSEDTDALGSVIGLAIEKTDLLLISGGASVGAYDCTAAALERSGFTIHCRKVRSRPGKPLIFAMRGPIVAFGLPGNPLSHFVCFHLFVQRALAQLSAAESPRLIRAVLEGESRVKSNPRETWWPCRLRFSEDGALTAQPLPWRDSSDLTTLANTNGLIRIRPEASLARTVEVLPCGPLF